MICSLHVSERTAKHCKGEHSSVRVMTLHITLAEVLEIKGIECSVAWEIYSYTVAETTSEVLYGVPLLSNFNQM